MGKGNECGSINYLCCQGCYLLGYKNATKPRGDQKWVFGVDPIQWTNTCIVFLFLTALPLTHYALNRLAFFISWNPPKHYPHPYTFVLSVPSFWNALALLFHVTGSFFHSTWVLLPRETSTSPVLSITSVWLIFFTALFSKGHFLHLFVVSLPLHHSPGMQAL